MNLKTIKLEDKALALNIEFTDHKFGEKELPDHGILIVPDFFKIAIIGILAHGQKGLYELRKDEPCMFVTTPELLAQGLAIDPVDGVNSHEYQAALACAMPLKLDQFYNTRDEKRRDVLAVILYNDQAPFAPAFVFDIALKSAKTGQFEFLHYLNIKDYCEWSENAEAPFTYIPTEEMHQEILDAHEALGNVVVMSRNLWHPGSVRGHIQYISEETVLEPEVPVLDEEVISAEEEVPE